MINCLLLGFQVGHCTGSGEHPLCRKCLGQVAPPPKRAIQDEPETPVTRRGIRRRCECGRAFIPGSNRQRVCERCGEVTGRKRKAEWARKKSKGKSESRRLEAKLTNEIGIL